MSSNYAKMMGGSLTKLMRYLVFFEQGDINYSAYVPDLPVCIAVGDTLEETRKEISEAIKFHIECLQEDGEVVPKSTSKLPDQTPSGVSAEFVNIEVEVVKPKKRAVLPSLTPTTSRFKRKTRP